MRKENAGKFADTVNNTSRKLSRIIKGLKSSLAIREFMGAILKY